MGNYVLGNYFPPKLLMWHYESISEKNFIFRALSHLKDRFRKDKDYCINFALFPQSLYKRIEKFTLEKTIDYCFIGGYKTDKETQKSREWMLEFIENNFTDSSHLQFTDKITKLNYQEMGNFDFTLKKKGFVPKEYPMKLRNYYDEDYYRTLSRSKFALCPAGDAPWSMRFYEALMCKSIPIVDNKRETFRCETEAKLDYKYYFTNEQHVYREDWVLHNYGIFLKYHTLEHRTWL